MSLVGDQVPRKRAVLVESEFGTELGQVNATKKARLTPSQDQDGGEDDEDKTEADRNLEAFRKEAIWREMQEYKRKFKRAQQQVEELQDDRRLCEAKLSAVEISWNLLVSEADLLLPSTSTAINGHSNAANSPSVSDPALSDERLQQALEQRSAATKALLNRLQSLHPAPDTSEKVTELEAKCHELLEQSLRSQQAHRLLRVEHEAKLEELETTYKQLLQAEKRVDRLKSATVQAMESRGPAGTAAAETAAPAGPDGVKSESSPASGLAVPKVETGAASPSPGPAVSATSGQALEDLRLQLSGRTKDLEEVREDRVALRRELDALKARLSDLPEDAVTSSTPFQTLQSHLQHLTAEHDARRADFDRVSREADSLREGQEGFRVKTMREASEQVDDIQQRLAAKEGDLSRIRAQREDLKAETTELKAKDSAKLKHVDQVHKLNQSLEERVKAYDSQVQRLRMQVAALEGDSAMVEQLAKSSDQDTIKDLQKRLQTAEELLRALSEQLAAYTKQSGAPNAEVLAKSETEVRLEHSATKARLAKLEALVRTDSDGDDAERGQLVRKLEEREERVRVLEAQVKAQDPTMEALYSEIERLSGAWQLLDEQNSAKVWIMASTEEKLQRLSVEKAKADNRYFGMCRQQENLTAENAVLHKLAEKQRAAKEAQDELHRSLSEQLAALEKEVSALQLSVRGHQDEAIALRRERDGLTIKHEHAIKRVTELTTSLHERAAAIEVETAARKAADEAATKAQRELKSYKAVSGPVSFSGGSDEIKELREYNNDLQKMLKCSTCSQRFKSVAITRCGHLFCKECVDARLANRQRKCPSCAVPFGSADVMNVYL